MLQFNKKSDREMCWQALVCAKQMCVGECGGDPFSFVVDYDIVKQSAKSKQEEQVKQLVTDNVEFNLEFIQGVLFKKSDNEPRFAKLVYREGCLQFRVNEDDLEPTKTIECCDIIGVALQNDPKGNAFIFTIKGNLGFSLYTKQ